MATMWREIQEASWLDCGRNGVVTGEKLFAQIPDGQSNGTDSALLPKIGEAYDSSNPLCILTSFRKNQYKSSDKVSYLCRYTTEEILRTPTGFPVPRDKYTSGGEVYSLSKDFIAQWSTAPIEAINQVTQILIPNGQCEVYGTNSIKADAYSAMNAAIGKISATKPQWLNVSGEVTECCGIAGQQLISSPPTLYYRIRFLFANRQDSAGLGWNALYRENATPPAWQLTDAPVYANATTDFAGLLPF